MKKKQSKKKAILDYGSIQTTDGLGNSKTFTATFPSPGTYEFDAQVEYVSQDQAHLNRLEVHDGTAELRLKLKNSLDFISWENNGKTITGKAEKLRFIVYVGDEDYYVGIYEKPFLGDAQLVRHLDIDNSLYEKIALRASTSVPNRSILKLLTAL